MFINNFVLLRLNIALFYVGYTCCLTVAIKQICYVMSSTNTSMKYYRSILLLLSGILRAAQSVLGVYFKRTSSRDTSASSARGRILNDSALYKSTHSLTHSPVFYDVTVDAEARRNGTMFGRCIGDAEDARHELAGHENARNAIVWNTECCICLSIAEQECMSRQERAPDLAADCVLVND